MSELDESLAVVQQLSAQVARLEQELDLAKLRLRDAWARVPYDPTVLDIPYKSDTMLTCSECGRGTRWVRRGIARCQPFCKEVRENSRRTTPGIPRAVWDILAAADDDTLDILDEGLDDE